MVAELLLQSAGLVELVENRVRVAMAVLIRQSDLDVDRVEHEQTAIPQDGMDLFVQHRAVRPFEMPDEPERVHHVEPRHGPKGQTKGVAADNLPAAGCRRQTALQDADHRRIELAEIASLESPDVA